jgi:hypothetical protein
VPSFAKECPKHEVVVAEVVPLNFSSRLPKDVHGNRKPRERSRSGMNGVRSRLSLILSTVAHVTPRQ